MSALAGCQALEGYDVGGLLCPCGRNDDLLRNTQRYNYEK